jgi:hypothetical protein
MKTLDQLLSLREVAFLRDVLGNADRDLIRDLAEAYDMSLKDADELFKRLSEETP